MQPSPGFGAQEYRNIPLESYTSSFDVLGTLEIGKQEFDKTLWVPQKMLFSLSEESTGLKFDQIFRKILVFIMTCNKYR